jgi:hypothetical protein
MVKQAVRVLTIVMGFFAIGGFVTIYGHQIHKGWPHPTHAAVANETNGSGNSSPDPADQKIDDPYSYVATSLASLVGAIVAVMFGRPAPGVSSKNIDWASLLAVIYAYVYVLMGVAALVTWVKNPQAPVLVKTLALAFFGLLIPVVTSFLKPGALTNLLRGTDEG